VLKRALIYFKQARTIVSVLDELNIGQVDFLKMDIEGAEESALRGMEKGRRILLEVHPTILAERDRTAHDVLNLLLEAGYNGWWIDISPEANRKAGYASVLNLGGVLRPVVDAECVDAWPHILSMVPGLEVLS
jgi:methyltransferase FkbM-like protein